MSVSYKIKLSSSPTTSAVTATTISIPLSLEYQTVDNAEIIQRKFVDVEVENAINPILNYEKVRFIPVTPQGTSITTVIYDLSLFDENGVPHEYYGGIGFTDDDIKFRHNAFKQSFLNLNFYDTNNTLTQKLVANITLFSNLNSSDFLGFNTGFGVAGQPKPANQIPFNFVAENPLVNPRGFAEGFHLYDYKDELQIGTFKYLYMRASFKNAKTGKGVNLMVKDIPKPVNELVNELYTRYKLIRTTNGYFYQIDNTYDGNNSASTSNNVSYVGNAVTINLFQIKAT
jgi:hypothetical protein